MLINVKGKGWLKAFHTPTSFPCDLENSIMVDNGTNFKITRYPYITQAATFIHAEEGVDGQIRTTSESCTNKNLDKRES